MDSAPSNENGDVRLRHENALLTAVTATNKAQNRNNNAVSAV